MQRMLFLFLLCASQASWASGAFDQPRWKSVLTVARCSTPQGRESLTKYFQRDEPKELIELEETPGISLYWGPVYVQTQEDRKIIEDTGMLFFLTGRTAVIAGGYRTLKIEIGLACDEVLRAHRRREEPRIPSMLAVPGTSMHGKIGRLAVDIQLGDEDGVPLWTGTYAQQWRALAWYIRELAALMYSTGWYRYVAEIWHFERAPRRNVRRGCYTFPDGPGCGSEPKWQPQPAELASASPTGESP